jgi:nucleoside-diphosphate-sugar epimerase
MIFVTGGTGLVGSHVLLRLVKQSKGVKALRRTSSSLKICEKVFEYYDSSDLFHKIQWYTGDVNDIASLENGMQGCDFLLHCAAIVSFDPSDRSLLQKVNIEGTANVMNVALDLGIKKAGFVSSIAALDTTFGNELINETAFFQVNKIASTYSLSKYFSEQEVWRIAAEGLDVIIVNPSVILGPGDWKKGSSQIFQKIFKGLNFYTTGSTGYVDVIDVSDALIQLLFSDIKNQRFILNGSNLTYRDCFNKIADAFGKPRATIRVTPFLKEFVWRIEAIKSWLTGKKPLITKETANNAMIKKSYDNTKIKEAIGFQFTTIDDTILKYANWFIETQE